MWNKIKRNKLAAAALVAALSCAGIYAFTDVSPGLMQFGAVTGWLLIALDDFLMIRRS